MIWRCDLAAQYEMYAEELDAAIRRVLKSGIYVLGENVAAFEREFAAYVGVAHGIGVNSGTDALMMALWCFGLQAGDEVITTPFTAIPTYSAIRHVSARPVFVDIDPASFLMDLNQVERAMSSRTKAVVPVHLFGNVVDINTLRRIVGPDVFILEDCAQSHGATICGARTGSLGDIAAFSFYPTKNLGGYGDGGLVVTNRKDFEEAIRLRRTYGMISKDEFIVDGINSRLDELQSAVLRVKLRHLDAMNARRRDLAARYRARLDPKFFTPQAIPEGVVSNHHVYCGLCADGRDALVKFLEARGIQSNVYYPMPLSQQVGYRGAYAHAPDLPVAADVAKRIIALPFYPEMPRETLDMVADAVNEFFRRG